MEMLQLKKQELFDGGTLKAAFEGAERNLETHIEEINTLNVFPVPDGDTGINMFLTIQAANKAWLNVETDSASAISAAAARGALLGACGNSGVILSQILRGFAKGLEAKESFTSVNFAEALHSAAEMARSAVINPLEGTIITVCRETSEMATHMAERGASLKQMMRAIASQAMKTVKKTPDLMPLLKEAGVVDAGAKGLFYIFQGMSNYIPKRVVTDKALKLGRVNTRTNAFSQSYGYDVQFLIRDHQFPVHEIRSNIEAMGESVLVVGDNRLTRVHIHTIEPDIVLNYARNIGEITDLVTANLDEQVKEFIKKRNNNGH
jgi:DAK2 domain fusion protein YloV